MGECGVKYTLFLDRNNYVTSIGHSKNDNIELNLTDIDLNYISAYRYINNELILDEDKKQQLIDEEEAEKHIPTDFEKLEAQVMYTAMITDTLLDEEI